MQCDQAANYVGRGNMLKNWELLLKNREENSSKNLWVQKSEVGYRHSRSEGEMYRDPEDLEMVLQRERFTLVI